MESRAIARFVRISPRKARVVVNLVRGQTVAQALDMLAFTRKAGAPIVKKLIESALSNAKQADSNIDVDALYVTTGMVDKGPNRNMRRWRPRAMGRATQIVKGVSHIQIVLTDSPPPRRPKRNEAAKLARRAAKAARAEATSAAAATTTTAQ
jgi:large subunit ribosomal protein L22